MDMAWNKHEDGTDEEKVGLTANLEHTGSFRQVLAALKYAALRPNSRFFFQSFAGPTKTR
jgi:hypothetical protein